jgi:hypothetical protein
VASTYCRMMRFEIEFFRCTKQEPDGKVIRRNTGQFASERDVEAYGLIMRPDDADGFRISKDGVLRKTVSIRTEE